MQDLPARLYRFRPRLTRRQQAQSTTAAAAAVVVAIVATGLSFAGFLPAVAGLLLALGSLLAGAIAWFAIRQGFEAFRQPKEYRDALQLVAEGKRDAALERVQAAITRIPSAFGPWTLRGMLLVESGEYEAGLAAYREAIARQPEHWLGHSGAGGALLNLGRLPEAVESLGRALALGAIWPVPRYQLGLALFLRGEYAGAAEAFGEALALGLETPNVQLVARTLRAWALEHTGSLDAAREEQERARPLRSLDEVGAFRDRLRGARLSPVGKLAAWAVGVDTSDTPPKL